MNNQIYMQRLAAIYNPGDENWNGYDPKATAEKIPGIITLFEEYLAEYQKETGDDIAKKITDISSKSLRATLKDHPPACMMVIMSGQASPEELVETTKRGINEVLKTYLFIMDEGEKFLKAFEQITINMREIHAQGLVGSTLVLPSEKDRRVLNTMLEDLKLPKIEEIFEGIVAADTIRKERDEATETLKVESKKFQEELSRLRDIASQLNVVNTKDFTVQGDGTIPNGEVTYESANKIFGLRLKKDFQVPVFTWDGVHPLVPQKDPNYIFRPKELSRALFALVTNQRAYLQGDTGSGKTTLLEQIAAHLNFPFIRINFDSEITRADLIGQHILEVDKETGQTVSRFVEGLLPQAMSSPCIACFDELDFVRPDVAYVMQAATEGNGLKLMEDGGREVRPHPMFRMFATGNTVGQGDEDGRYQGARPQSLALLDRFTIWVNVPYLDSKQRKRLLENACPMLTEEERETILKYVTEHLEAFRQGKVHQPISPRAILAIGHATNTFGDVKEAVSMTVLDRATGDDRSVLTELVNRTVK